jgi:hypothetical protein
MGFTSGGIIVKSKVKVSNNDLLNMLGRSDYEYTEDISLERATSGQFYGVAVARVKNILMILGRDLPYSFSLEDDQLSFADDAFIRLSENGDVLCFLSDSISSTYGWAIFSGGRRARVKTVSVGRLLHEVGVPTSYEDGIEPNDEGIFHLIEHFTGYSFYELIFENKILATAYEE